MTKKPKTATTSRERQAKRLATLNKVAKSLGYDSWRKYETAMIRKAEGR